MFFPLLDSLISSVDGACPSPVYGKVCSSNVGWVGIVKLRTLTYNQKREVMQELVANVLVPRRPA